MRIFRRFNAAIDAFWAASWWWRFRFYLEERRLEAVLEHHTDESLLARTSTEALRKLEFAIQYWRPASPIVGAAILAGRRAGLSLSDIRVLNLNRDIRQIGASIRVHESPWMWLIAVPALSIILIHWTLMTLLVVMTPADLVLKLIGASTVTGIYWFLWRGMALYTTRSLNAFKRSGNAFREVLKALEGRDAVASVHKFPERR